MRLPGSAARVFSHTHAHTREDSFTLRPAPAPIKPGVHPPTHRPATLRDHAAAAAAAADPGWAAEVDATLLPRIGIPAPHRIAPTALPLIPLQPSFLVFHAPFSVLLCPTRQMASKHDEHQGDLDLVLKGRRDKDDQEEDDSTYAHATLSAVLSLFPQSPISRASIHALPELIAAWVHVFVLLPLALCLAVTSHVFLNRSMWARGGGPPRLSFPVRRARNWSLRDTASVAVVSHLLPAFTRLSRTHLCPSAEKLIPYFSQSLFGVKHQGWSIGGVSVTLEPLPTEVAVTVPSRTSQNSVKSSHTDSLPSGSAVFIWKSQASNVHHHAVQSFKPAVSCGGIGAGAAREDERVILLLSGASYADRDPVAGLLACNLVNLCGLRTLCVNWRKPVPYSSASEGAFPAGLNDALQAYIHLVRTLGFKPDNICLTAEGSGAGVAMGLMIWLSALANDGKGANLGRPGKVILWTPWCDLTMRSPTWQTNGEY